MDRCCTNGGLGQLGQEPLGQLTWCRSIVRETLRLYPVAPFVTRLLSTDSDVGGYHVPAGVGHNVYQVSPGVGHDVQ